MFKNIKEFGTKHLGVWSDNLSLINDFRQLVGSKMFDFGFDPVFHKLQEVTYTKYIDFLKEARNKILNGEDPQEVLHYYDIMLQDEMFTKREYGIG